MQNQSNGAEVACLSSDNANLRAPEAVNTVQLVSVLISLRFESASTENSEESSNIKAPTSLASIASLINGEVPLRDNQPARKDWRQNFGSLLENDEHWPRNKFMDMDCASRATAVTQKSERPIFSKAIYPLTDIALRSLICPRPMRPPAAIASCQENTLISLANLAPAIFIPGYRDAVQSRAKFIPAIAKFLSQFLKHSGHQAQSGRNAQETQSIFIEPLAGKDISQQKENVKRHLWMTLTNGVKNVESARKLKPLHVTRTGGPQQSPSRTFEDLLNLWRPSEGSDTTCSLEEGFEDLQLDEEQDFADSEDEYFSDLYDGILSRSATGDDNVTKAMNACFDDEFLEVLSSSPLPDRTLGATSNLACSTSKPDGTTICKHTAVAAAHSGSHLSHTASKDLDARLDSSDSQLNEATQRSMLHSRLDVIGGNDSSRAYVSRRHPSYTLEDGNTSRAEPLLLEQFDTHAFIADRSDSLGYEQSSPSETQNIIDIVEDQHSTLLDNFDHDIEMPSYEKSNRSSLTDIIGGDHLLWQMWTKRRPSMIQTDEDMLEMHAMYAQDPDMRLLDTHKELDNNGDDYMLDSETSNTSSINSASSMDGRQDFVFPYGPNPVAERKHHHPFHLHKDSSPTSSQSDTSRPASRRKLSRGQSFLKRLSGTRSSLEELSSSSRPFSRDEPRDVEIKRRKTLADYDQPLDGDEMLLS